jgi:hypothetical protein
LVQGFGIVIGDHLPLQFSKPPDLDLDQVQGKGPAAEERSAIDTATGCGVACGTRGRGRRWQGLVSHASRGSKFQNARPLPPRLKRQRATSASRMALPLGGCGFDRRMPCSCKPGSLEIDRRWAGIKGCRGWSRRGGARMVRVLSSRGGHAPCSPSALP